MTLTSTGLMDDLVSIVTEPGKQRSETGLLLFQWRSSVAVGYVHVVTFGIFRPEMVSRGTIGYIADQYVDLTDVALEFEGFSRLRSMSKQDYNIITVTGNYCPELTLNRAANAFAKFYAMSNPDQVLRKTRVLSKLTAPLYNPSTPEGLRRLRSGRQLVSYHGPEEIASQIHSNAAAYSLLDTKHGA